MPLFLSLKTQTVHIKSIEHNRIAMISLKTLYPGGIWTRVFYSWGGCDVYAHGQNRENFHQEIIVKFSSKPRQKIFWQRGQILLLDGTM
jgi:hypothetical protein